jgi:hypothetical protein
MKKKFCQTTACALIIALVCLFAPLYSHANGGTIILQPVDMHFELAAAGLPTVANVDSMIFTGIEYRNTAGSGPIAVGDTARIDGVLGISSFMVNGSQVIPAGFNMAWELTGTYVALQDMVASVDGSTITYVTGDVGILTLYVGTDMSQQANFLTGLGFDDGTMVAQFAVQYGGGSYLINGALDGDRDFFMVKQSGLAGFFDPDIQVGSFDSNLDADDDNNGIGGNDPIPTAWKYPTASPEVSFPRSYYATTDGSLQFGHVPSCDVDIEKQVRELTIPVPEWADADLCTDDDVPEIFVPGGAEYQLIVTNEGESVLTNCTITDVQLGINYDIMVDLAPGEVKTLDQNDIEALIDEERCDAAGQLANTATIVCQCADVAGEQVDDSDTACIICEEREVGQCRMTHGSVTVNQDGTFTLEGLPAEVTQISGTSTKGKGKKALTSSVDEAWYTWGGQIGASQANDPSFGEMSHVQHNHPLYGSFTFHAGTHSASPGTEITSVECADERWCENARCAPYKQLFWNGIGEFENLKDNMGWDADCDVAPKSGHGRNVTPGTFHYIEAHVADFGEPGGNFDNPNGPQSSESLCDWTSGGTDINNVNLIGGPNGVVPPPDGEQHADKGGQECDECPDFYEIEIHCTADPSTELSVLRTY